jgi:hypothetical protein
MQSGVGVADLVAVGVAVFVGVAEAGTAVLVAVCVGVADGGT